MGPSGKRLILIRHLQILEESSGFQWRVFLATSAGFFSASYSLFAMTAIFPAMSFVWSTCSRHVGYDFSLALDSAAIAGAFLGMLAFGYSADRYGRQAAYGLELLILLLSTIGVVTSSGWY